ncbi:DUF2920 family protein [Sulfurimonas marina]|uniref:DUF2920 family protein n=1 Tax=Sulfurimonas marina TaxID=2590551 RepID=A0A7M1AXL3_9BACT|nr:DUF2920 family protein [Sulfurimonas marina]QOP42155.1 DUF2920 family protein [Sulfurimonas marina]
MVEFKTVQIEGHDDFELNIKRESKLTYHISYKADNKHNGIIFLIPGFGEDASVEYQKKLLTHITEEYGLLSVFVEYHAIFSRPTNGAIISFDEKDGIRLIDIIKKYNVVLDENDLSVKSILLALNRSLPKDNEEIITATLYPAKNEYQNFGILQAIDILTVLYDLKSSGYGELIEHSPIIAMGSSHGGYIANLLAKLAPNTFDFIIDNSCYVKPPLKYIVGKEHDITRSELKTKYSNFILSSYTLTHWTKDPQSKNHFSNSAYEIRDLTNQSHLNEQLKTYNSKTSYISYHSKYDQYIAPYDDKLEYVNHLKEYGTHYTFMTIESEDQIDGKLIKNLDHAMGASNKEILRNTLPSLLTENINSGKTDLCNQSIISYTTSENNTYEFRFSENNISARITSAS